jgi:hypothetical protein
MNLQKLRLGQLKPADGATTLGDVYYPQTVLLAPFEGTNGSTSTSDLSTRVAAFRFLHLKVNLDQVAYIIIIKARLPTT